MEANLIFGIIGFILIILMTLSWIIMWIGYKIWHIRNRQLPRITGEAKRNRMLWFYWKHVVFGNKTADDFIEEEKQRKENKKNKKKE